MKKTSLFSHQIGKQKELQACDYLLAQGLKLIMQNYRCKLGEIDLIMLEHEILVFIEVRYRKQNAYGDGSESINSIKQHKIISAAQHYLLCNDFYNKYPCRFDAIITINQNHKPKFLWIKDAFWVK